MKKNKISQEKLGREFGFKRGVIGTYIRGIAEPSIDTLQKISAYFNVNIDNLINQDLSKNDYLKENKSDNRVKENDIVRPLLRYIESLENQLEKKQEGTETTQKKIKGGESGSK